MVLRPKSPLDCILLVEDSEDDARLIERAFTKATVENPTYRFATAGEAVRYLQGSARDAGHGELPLAVLLDLGHGGGSGLDFLRWLRRQPEFRNLPVVVLTRFIDKESIDSAYRAGADLYLRKPISTEQVATMAKQIEGHWRALGQIRRIVFAGADQSS
jgi:CheY-like chemotaxis protein